MRLTYQRKANPNPECLDQKTRSSQGCTTATRTAKQWSAVFAQKRSCHVPTIKLTKNKFILGSENIQHSALTRHKKQWLPGGCTGKAAPSWCVEKKKEKKSEVPVTAAFVFTNARSLRFQKMMLSVTDVTHTKLGRPDTQTSKIKKEDNPPHTHTHTHRLIDWLIDWLNFICQQWRY